jgi:hypothetical protein
VIWSEIKIEKHNPSCHIEAITLSLRVLQTALKTNFAN